MPSDIEILDLLTLAQNVKTNSKGEVVAELVQKSTEKFLIFTEFRATQDYLVKLLKHLGVKVVKFCGDLNTGEKEQAKEEFACEAQVMVSTESGGEGLNLQFCHQLINFDLPWNPMKVEQRIGRVHRFGQLYEVQIINLSTKDTIEEYILFLLHQKINLFENVIGDLEQILSQVGSAMDWEKRIMEILVAKDESTDGFLEVNVDRGFEELVSGIIDVPTVSLPNWA